MHRKAGGPGDLLFSRELNVDGNRLYIAMQGFRVSRFNCEPEVCEYETTIETPYNNYSVSAEDGQIYILGLAPFGRPQDPDPDNTEQYAFHIFDEAGDVKSSFGPLYNHKSPMIREGMHSSGTVRFYPQHGFVTGTFSRFPFIYIYDSNGNYSVKYRIPDFKQGYYDYNETTRVARTRSIDHSSIYSTKKIDDDWLLLSIRNYKTGEEVRFVQFDYYAFHIPTGQIYLAGRDETYPFEEARVIHTTKSGLLINQQGTLYWIQQ